jgi:hypothetical protein
VSLSPFVPPFLLQFCAINLFSIFVALAPAAKLPKIREIVMPCLDRGKLRMTIDRTIDTYCIYFPQKKIIVFIL